MPSSWFAVCLSHDPDLLHLSWFPLAEEVQEKLREAVARTTPEIEVEGKEGRKYTIVLRYHDNNRFKDALQINQATKLERPIRRFRGSGAEHYLRVVAMAKNIVWSTVIDMDEETTPVKKRRTEGGCTTQPPPSVPRSFCGKDESGVQRSCCGKAESGVQRSCCGKAESGVQRSCCGKAVQRSCKEAVQRSCCGKAVQQRGTAAPHFEQSSTQRREAPHHGDQTEHGDQTGAKLPKERL
jgi:hypothetical protein